MPVCDHCGEEHSLPGSYMSHVLTCAGGNGTAPPKESVEVAEPTPDGDANGSTVPTAELDAEDAAAPTLDGHVQRVVSEQLSAVESEIERVSADLEELEKFATISLGERRLSQTEENLSEFSTSLTELSERTLEKVTDLEARLELQEIVLATVLEALAEADVEADVSAIRDYQRDHVVTEQSSSERLETAIDAVES
ncbi:hypothetical protein [Natrinema salifodinae]|uniref:Uncharacterized protein n=1 Tax=Natrinema salifodinae TaxID=1202768 RepID=A0A1I0QSG6_9EURY|nr:hypothetical protein [Natrinema salifodinae]SEW30540.1 hypothetical protein SAMN05216285_3866 [Natrinema salifodinae]